MMVKEKTNVAIQQYENAYSKTRFEVTQAAYRKRLLIEQLDKLRPKRILEVGCGWDSISNHWQEFEALTIVEPGPNFAQKARSDSAAIPNVNVIEQFLEQVPAKDLQNYDCILLSSLLHEVEDDQAFLQTVKQLCGTDTVVHLNVPNANSFHRLLAVEMKLIDSVDQPSEMQKHYNQERIYDLNSLSQLICQLGFRIIDQGSFFIKPFTHAQMQKFVDSGSLSKQMLDGLYRMSKHLPENGSEIYVNFSLENH